MVSGLDLHCSCLLWKQMWSVSHPNHQCELELPADAISAQTKMPGQFSWTHTHAWMEIQVHTQMCMQVHIFAWSFTPMLKSQKRIMASRLFWHTKNKTVHYECKLHIRHLSLHTHIYRQIELYRHAPTKEWESTHTMLPCPIIPPRSHIDYLSTWQVISDNGWILAWICKCCSLSRGVHSCNVQPLNESSCTGRPDPFLFSTQMNVLDYRTVQNLSTDKIEIASTFSASLLHFFLSWGRIVI